ncbi:hypothetical protein [Cognatilysobacter terrigena]|uniref:hypothetical protein n=1 Tax=Cognatilysobacter terrigena TaxID=2488749 RepID=UPI00105E3E21|nr:hypothetical protein [Lysobacter terrigena]
MTAARFVLTLFLLAAASAAAASEPPAAAPQAAPQSDISAQFDADVARYQPLVEESAAIKKCVDAELARRGLDMQSAMDVLDATPDAPTLRTNLLRLIDQDVELSADDRKTLDADGRLRVPYIGYQTKGAATFDLGVVARVIAVQSVYLDRALDSRCGPSPKLLTFIGVTPRAD